MENRIMYRLDTTSDDNENGDEFERQFVKKSGEVLNMVNGFISDTNEEERKAVNRIVEIGQWFTAVQFKDYLNLLLVMRDRVSDHIDALRKELEIVSATHPYKSIIDPKTQYRLVIENHLTHITALEELHLIAQKILAKM